MYSFLTILFFYFKCFPDKKWSFRMVLKQKYVSNLCIAQERRNKVNCKKKTYFDNADSFRIFLRIQHIYCSLGIFPYRTPILSKYVFFLQLTLFLLSWAMHKLLTYFCFKTMRNDHFLSGKHLKSHFRVDIYVRKNGWENDICWRIPGCCIKRWRLINYRQIYGVCRMIQS
jgi:hypothetical protein